MKSTTAAVTEVLPNHPTGNGLESSPPWKPHTSRWDSLKQDTAKQHLLHSHLTLHITTAEETKVI